MLEDDILVDPSFFPWSEVIDRLAGDDALRQRLETNASRVARERFDPHRLAAA